MRNIIRRLATNIIILLISKTSERNLIKKVKMNLNYQKAYLTDKLTRVLPFKERSCRISQHYFLFLTFGIKTLEALSILLNTAQFWMKCI